MKNLKILLNGLLKENPTFVLLLGMCPTLATTTSAVNGLSMGLATTFVLICSNVAVSVIKKVTPDMVRIPVFVVLIASFVTVLQMALAAWLPSVNASLGLYIPLIVVNCIILGRAEAFACKNTVVASLFDGAGMGLGFTLGLTLLGMLREFLGTGTLFGLSVVPEQYDALSYCLRRSKMDYAVDAGILLENVLRSLLVAKVDIFKGRAHACYLFYTINHLSL